MTVLQVVALIAVAAGGGAVAFARLMEHDL